MLSAGLVNAAESHSVSQARFHMAHAPFNLGFLTVSKIEACELEVEQTSKVACVDACIH